MQRIIAPLQLGEQSEAVANLQDALRAIIHAGYLTLDPGDAEILLQRLTEERAESIYGDATGTLVELFSKQEGLGGSNQVDEATAERLNEVLADLGLLDGQTELYIVQGRVLDLSNNPISYLTVRAFDQARGEETLGETTTNAEGYYQITYAPARFRPRERETRGPDLIVRAFSHDGQMLVESPLRQDAGRNETVDLIVDVPIEESPRFIVRGQVLLRDSTACTGARITVHYRGLQSEGPLSEAVATGEDGRYEITYDASKFLSARVSRIGLFVRVRYQEGQPPVNSRIIYNPGPEETVDFEVGEEVPILSEHKRLANELEPLMETIPLAELTPPQIEFLAGSISQDPQQIALLVQAASLEEQTKETNPNDPPIPAAFFYGLLRKDQPANLEDLLVEPDDRLRQTFEDSLRENLIPAELGEQADSIFTALDTLKVLQTLKPASPDSPASLGDLLETLPESEKLSRNQQVAFARLHHQYGNSAALIEAMSNTQELNGTVPVLKRTMSLADLTQNHAPLMSALQARVSEVQPESDGSIEPLASFAARDWIELALEHGAPTEAGISSVEYATRLERSVEQQFPSAVLRERLHNGTLQIENFPSQMVEDFLTEHRDFDFLRHDVDTFLDSQAIDSPELRDGLKQVKRLLPVTSRIDAIAALQNEGMTSRFKIAYAGPDLLHARLGDKLDEDTIRAIHQAASSSVDTSIALSTMKIAPKIGVDTTLHEPSRPSLRFAALRSSGATLRTLFGAMEFCECQHCQSVLGPAAYLADLLHFMETSPAELGGTILEALVARRPDLLDLELSCENTNTEIPYIDLVLEVLENAVAFDPALELPLLDEGGTSVEEELNQGRVPPVVQTELRKTAVTMGDSFIVTTGPMSLILLSPRQSVWVISDHARRWQVTYQPKQLVGWRKVRYMILGTEIEIPVRILLPRFTALSDIEAGLQAGSLHSELRQHFAPEPVPPIKGTPQVRTVVRTPSGTPGWEISIRQEVQVEIQMGAPFGAVRIFSEGQVLPIFEQTFPLGLMQLIVTWLNGNATEAQARAAMRQLELPQTLDYKISRDTSTNRVILQVDTNVILAIAPELLTVNALSYQNSSIQADLMAMPENRNPEAYRKLRGAVFPWTLPLDLWTEEIRALLAELGVPRQRLIEMAKPSKLLRSKYYMAESLGLSAAELHQIVHPAGSEPWLVWGLQERNNSITDTLAASVRFGGWLDVLEHVSLLMQLARLSYREVLQVLQTSRGGIARPGIEPEDPLNSSAEECQPSKLLFSILDPALLDWIHRFTRLQRRLGWSARDLDGALAVFDNSINLKSVRGLAQMRRLNGRLHTTVLSVCAMLGHLETRPWTRYMKEGSPIDPSLYERLYQPQALHTSASNNFFKLNDDGKLTYLDKNPPLAAEVLSNHSEFVASCLGIKTLELEQLIGAAGEVGISNEVRLENLGILYGVVQFARALDLNVDEFLRWQKVLDCFPFKGASVDHALSSMRRTHVRLKRAHVLLDFVDALDFAKRNGQSLQDLEYLLRHEVPPDLSTKMTTRLLEGVSNIRAALQSGEVLGNTGHENLIRQLERASAPPALIVALSSDEGFSNRLRAEIVVSPIPQPRRVIPQNLRERFYFTAAADEQSARFGCRGILSGNDFDNLVNVDPGADAVPESERDALKSRYGLVREMLLSQLHYHPVPVLSVEVAAAPSPAIPADFAEFLFYNESEGRIELTGLITASESGLLQAALPQLSAQIVTLLEQSDDFRSKNHTLLTADLVHDLTLTTPSDDLILRALRCLVPILERDLLAAQVASFTGLDQNLSGALLRRVQVAAGGAVRSVQDVFFDNVMLETKTSDAIDAGQFSAQLQALSRLDKVAVLLANSGLTVERLEWLTDDIFEVIEINALPTAAGQPAASFAAWRAWAELLLLVRSIPEGQLTVDALVDLIKAKAADPSSVDEPGDALARAYELPEKEVLNTYNHLLNLTWPGDFRKPCRLLQLAEVLNLLKRLGTSPAVLQKLVADEPDEQAALAARALFISHFDVDTAPKRLEPVSNRLRPKQRDALVDYLRTARALTDADELLDYFLIDVQMEAGMQTSRVKQAISSTQLFVQRCLLNLESHRVLPTDINADRWEWMKNYRVWEANRKVFLYPENWIEPELRDDKTEIFKQLESDLLQQDLTHENAVAALKQYLENAAALARLTVLSLCVEDLDQDYAVHLIAADRAKPRKHYYRRLQFKKELDKRVALNWSVWEQINGEVGQDHVLIFTVGHSLHIAYPIISSDNSQQFWQLGFASRRKSSDGWSRAKQASGNLLARILPNKEAAASIVFSVENLVRQGRNFTRIHCFGGRRPVGLVDEALVGSYLAKDDATKLFNLNAKIRVLERFTDSLGKQFLRETNLKLDVKTILELTADDGSGMAPSGFTTTYYGKFEFDDEVRKLKNPQDPNAARKYWCNDIKITAYGDPARHNVLKKTITASKPLGSYGEWFTDIVFDLKPDVSLGTEFDPNRNLDGELLRLGSFEVSEEFEILPIDKNASSAFPDFLTTRDSGTELFGPGFRRTVAHPEGLPLKLFTKTILSKTFGRFYFVANSRTGMIAYRDEYYTLLFLRIRAGLASSAYRVMAAGQDWIPSHALANLSAQLPNQISLVILPQSPGNTPDAIHLGIDASSSSMTSLSPTFDPSFPSSLYDWELFFHVPLLIATQLSQGQRFEEARRWFHTIFDPTSNSGEDETIRYWRFPPFRQAAKEEQEIDDFLEAYARNRLPENRKLELEANIEAWKDNPFNPHLIARFRKRSYMWAVVIKYIQNLLAWGDQLFRRDTIESINEATQLYVLAARILGKRPASSPRSESPVLSYRDLQGRLDDLSNKWIVVEDSIQEDLSITRAEPDDTPIQLYTDTQATVFPDQYNWGDATGATVLRSIGKLYFPIPQNENILKLWDTVEDRLFKIRHSMNIDGVERRLPLFEPPIDPALLVRAAAAGLDLAAVLNNLYAPLPLHRFSIMLQKALELSGDLRALGGALLSALEKKDAEELALLRSSHEMTLLNLTEQVRQEQIREAHKTLEGLRESRKTAEERFRHYQQLLGTRDIKIPQLNEGLSLAPVPRTLAKSGLDAKEQDLGISQTEQDQLRRLAEAQGLTLASGIVSAVAGVAFLVGSSFDPTDSAFKAAQSIGHGGNATASSLKAVADFTSAYGSRDAIIGGYERRRDEWIFQSNMALRELAQIDKQIAAAEIREAIATQELENTRQQIANAQEVDDFFRAKYSSQELYRFMSNQLLTIYFRMYQLAFEVAKRAERCFKFELGLDETSDSAFIKPGYWDSVRKGVLAGEQLHLDLRRMELAYLEQNKREYEITKHVSVLQLDPTALIALRQTGKCELSIPEALFDLDFPGHYLRRIKTVSLTIPCVMGPYSGVPCTLTLLKSEIRKSSSTSGGYARNDSDASDGKRFIDRLGPIQSIVTSSGQSDSGLFETNLRDERYLPFEGAGVISTWRIELPKSYPQFDYDTISDVILHVRYTARHGGELLKSRASEELEAALNAIIRSGNQSGFAHVFSLRHDFPTEWHRFVTTPDAHNQAFTISKERFSFWLQGQTITIYQIDLFGSPKANQEVTELPDVILPGSPELKNAEDIGQLFHQMAAVDVAISTTTPPLNFELRVEPDGAAILNPLEDILVVCNFTVKQ